MADSAAPNTIRQITKDEVYDAVAPTDFAAMLEIDRHLNRSTAFDKIISATHDHFWDPLDKKYIDFNDDFDPDTTDFIPDYMVPSLQTKYVEEFFADKPAERIRFKSQVGRWVMSSILHGEQGALNLSASLCHVLRDPGAQEYAANQTREEGRHVTAFAKYIIARWGTPLPCGAVLSTLLQEIVHAPEVYKKIIGMQMLVEGLAMGAFASIFKEWDDPLAKKLTQLVMTDEAFHHKFGKIWADRTIPQLSAEEHEIVENWAAHCFQTLLFNLVAPHQMTAIYVQFGLDPEQVMASFQEAVTDEMRRENMKEGTNIFRVLVKTLWNAGIITERTAGFYATYVNFDEFKAEGEEMVGDAIAEDGIKYLQTINFGINTGALSEVKAAAVAAE
ncbi:MAG TPA: ferritin-like domain-containing protein [Terricaulis sp.]|nr:ferritin-like domain-containing protein [Terricaulis sp.]HRP09874.1 ferritin-like domain-containing protein [Terricaulis sp.]